MALWLMSKTILSDNIIPTHISLFDNSQFKALEIKEKYPAFGFQGHPEASPGPHDVSYLFEKFIKLMKNA